MYFNKKNPLISLPSVAIVILNWNGKNYLKKFLPSVLASDYENMSVVVADNASTDDSVAFLRQNFPSVKIIENESNGGFARGYNLALKQVSADYYVLLNSDVEVSVNWIAPVILLMESEDSITVCQPKILSYENKSRFEYAGASGGWIDFLGYPFTRGRVFDYCEKDHHQYDTSAEIFWATGAALFVKAAAFHELNGFDEYFFAHQEEIDFCWRMKRAGFKVYAEPASVVYHVGGGTLPMGDRRKVFLNFRNNLVMLSKNLPFNESVLKIPLRIMMDILAAFQGLVQGNFSTFISILSADADFIKWLFVGKREKGLPKIKMVKLKGVYDGSIVWEYFIKKRRTFSEILGLKK